MGASRVLAFLYSLACRIASVASHVGGVGWESVGRWCPFLLGFLALDWDFEDHLAQWGW